MTSPIHWLIVLVIVLLLFGAGRLSDIGKGLGEGIKNFKKGIKDDDEGAGDKLAKSKADDDEEVEVVVKTKPKQLPAANAKKKKVIEVEVDEGADEAEVRRAIAEKKKAMLEEAEDETA